MNLSLQQSKRLTKIFAQAQSAEQAKQLHKAEGLYLEMLKVAPGLPLARAHLAFIYSATNRKNEAIMQFNKILVQAPKHALTHFNLANVYYELAESNHAIRHFELAINNDPNLVDAYIHCGMAYRLASSLDKAEHYLHKALNIDKKNAKAFHVLGSIYQEQKDMPRALECFQSAAALMPQLAQYRISFAEALEAVGFDHEAGLEFHKACETSPDYADGFIGYGEYLFKHNRYDEALECFQRAHALTPRNLGILDCLGKTYLGMNNDTLALTKYKEALNKEPTRIASLAGMGQVFIETGNVNAGLAIADKLIEIDPSHPIGFTLKSKIRKSSVSDGLSEHLLKLYQQSSLSVESKIEVSFSLGKIYNDQENYTAAFKYYSEGNALKNASINYSKEADEAIFSTLIQFFNEDFFTQHQHLGTECTKPILIIGMPRSGTTLTEQIISSHPQVIGAGEVTFWDRASTALALKLNTDTLYPQCVAELNAQQAHDIANIYETTLRKITGPNTTPTHITDKMPHNFLHVGLIALLFPNVKIIHTKRNAIDTCLSIFFQHFNDAHPYAFNLENLGFHYQQYQRIMCHWHRVLPGRILDINYEDTIDAPEHWSRKLINHLGLEWDDACLAPHKLERSVKTASHWQVRQPIYKTSIQRWKKYEEFLGPLKAALEQIN